MGVWDLLGWSLILLWMLYALRGQRLAWETHQLQWAQDLAFFHQIFYAASEGREWTSSLLLEPTGFWTMVHFHPLFALLLPGYLLSPEPMTLLLFNVLAGVLAALGLQQLARAESDSPRLGAAAAAAFCLWVPAWSAVGADFRPMAFWLAAFPWMTLGVVHRRWGSLALGLLLCCGAREESAWLLPWTGLIWMLLPWRGERRWRAGAVILGVGLGWMVFLLAFKENFFFHFDPRTWWEARESAPQTPAELREARLSYLLRSGSGGYLTGWLAAPAWLSGLPALGWLWGDAQREWQSMTGPYVHLRCAWTAWWASAGTLAAARLARRGLGWELGMASLLVLGNLAAMWPERRALMQRSLDQQEQRGGEDLVAIDRLLAQIPPEARVATDYRLIARLSGRRVLWNLAHLYLEDGQPPHWPANQPWPLGLETVDTLLSPEGEPLLERLGEEWLVADQGGGYVLHVRRTPPEGGFPPPLP